MGLELKYNPSGVCGNCLNRAHSICSSKTCECLKRQHNDSSWWADTKTQIIQVKLYYPAFIAGGPVKGHAIAHGRLTDTQVIIKGRDVEIVDGRIRFGVGTVRFSRKNGSQIPWSDRGWRLEAGLWQLEQAP